LSTILIYPKTTCEVGCEYCFSKPNEKQEYDKEKMMIALKEEIRKDRILNNGHDPTVVLHGGEICFLPLIDLEYFLKELEGIGITCGLQTSLMGMTRDHIRLFKKYGVKVGVSVDGPKELNILRGPRNEIQNQKYQDELISNLQILKDENLKFGTISILSKANASKENLPILLEWIKDKKIEGRFNAMFIPTFNSQLSKWMLSCEELKNAWIEISKVSIKENLSNVDPTRDYIEALLGYNTASCSTSSRCDYATTVCITVLGNGEISRCDRCLQDGVYLRSREVKTTARSDILEKTECAGCKYFKVCSGGCPSEGIGGDFRRKTYYCDAIYGTFEYLEKQLRGMFPNIVLSMDDPNYKKNEPFNWSRNMQRGTRGNVPPKDHHNRLPPTECRENKGHVNTPHGDHMNHINR